MFYFNFKNDVVENKSNSTELEKFVIKGLFGKHNVTLKFDNEARSILEAVLSSLRSKNTS